ncbi:hypothetical protein ACFYRC_37640 [Streptomyces sp. NPDC005279]
MSAGLRGRQVAEAAGVNVQILRYTRWSPLPRSGSASRPRRS